MKRCPRIYFEAKAFCQCSMKKRLGFANGQDFEYLISWFLHSLIFLIQA